MFTLASDEMIGKNLRELIINRYHNIQVFVTECLEEQGESITERSQKRMANKLSQIFNGHNRLQVSDLKLFSTVLDVSPEYILSAGQDYGLKRRQLTNAATARSLKPAVWKRYLMMHTERDVDEYGKTLVEYAMEYRNHALIHYLVETGRIKFWGETEAGRACCGFGAVMDCWGVSEDQEGFKQIPPRIVRDTIPWCLAEDPNLREGLMRLAIEASDLRLLQEMHARDGQIQKELCWGWTLEECGEVNDTLVDAIAAAEEDIIAYFAEEYQVQDNFGKQERWLSPYFEPLLHRLLETGNPLAERMLKTAVEHNQYAYDYLNRLFNGDQKNFRSSLFEYEEGREIIRQEILWGRKFNKAGNLVLYIDARSGDRLTTNLVRVDAEVSSEAMKQLAGRVNDIYEKVHTLQPTVEGKPEA